MIENFNPQINKNNEKTMNLEKIPLSGNPENKEEQDNSLRYQPFDPQEELEKIAKVPKYEKKLALSRYKENLISQMEGIANLEKKLEINIKSNPDAPIEEYFKIVESDAPNLRLSPQQIYIFDKALKEYQVAHQNVEKITKQYPDPNKLYQVLFKKKPKGKIEVIKTPMMIYFRCFNSADFAQIYYEKYLYNFSEDLNKAEADQIKNIQAVAEPAEKTQAEVHIAAENHKSLKKFKDDKFFESKIILHEEEHIIHSLIEKASYPKIKDYELMKKSILNSLEYKDLPQVADWMDVKKNKIDKMMVYVSGKEFSRDVDNFMSQKFIDDLKERFDWLAKSEILAHLKEAESLHKITDELFKINSCYNYFSENNKKLWAEDIKSAFPLAENPENTIKKAEGSYKNNLKKALETVNYFENIKGMNRQKILGLLILKPINSWFKMAKRDEEVAKSKK